MSEKYPRTPLGEDFAEAEFAASVAKWVRPLHVRTDSHWNEQAIVPNVLA